jgi:hemin uptake protein HemP
MDRRLPAAAPARPPTTDLPASRTLSTDELFRGATELRIVHGREEYRLRVTRQGKLILTK